MTTLIIPCAGRSSRFPGTKPKWMLTHPSGCLMVEKALSGINLEKFSRVVITIVKPHVEKYDADLVLRQAFGSNVELCILDDFTSSASETIYQTIQKAGITGDIVIKDCDNFVSFNLSFPVKNSIVGLNLNSKDAYVGNVANKSFLILNEQSLVESIVEKKIVSNTICLGVYCFESAEIFCKAFEILSKKEEIKELFVSYIVQYLLSKHDSPVEFKYIEACGYCDWGTLKDWKEYQSNYSTVFIDFDGVLVKNYGKYGRKNWDNELVPLDANLKALASYYAKGHQLVVTTARPECYRQTIVQVLKNYGIVPHAIVCGLNHASRVLINDFAATNPYPSAVAISMPRDGELANYLS